MNNRTIWLYPLLFLAFFDLHAQTPILPAYAYSLGASAALLGLILASYSFANMSGNIMSGPLIDRYGSKRFIVLSLTVTGLLLFLQGLVTTAEQLLVLRVITGFAIAFLSPAAFALLGKQGKGLVEQGKIMANNGIMITLASIISPVIGGYLADIFGFDRTFILLGIVLLIGGCVGWFQIEDDKMDRIMLSKSQRLRKNKSVFTIVTSITLFPAYLTAFTTTLGQGMLMYEVPYVMAKTGQPTTYTGFLLTMMGFGSLLTLMQRWLNRYSPYSRCFIGLTGIAAVFYFLAIGTPLSLAWLLFIKGAAHGLLFPAKATILTGGSQTNDYGKVFGIHSAVMSSGYVIGPIIAGTLREAVSPFFISFIFTMVMIILFIITTTKSHVAPVAWKS